MKKSKKQLSNTYLFFFLSDYKTRNTKWKIRNENVINESYFSRIGIQTSLFPILPHTFSNLAKMCYNKCRYGIKMPTLMHKCISMLSDTGLALSMFSLGTFMAVQPNIIACSMSQAATAMAARFLISPMLVAAISMLVGLHGIVLHTAIIQVNYLITILF